ncbi:MAG: nucleotidyltransferase family protein [Dehalococcoidia bacterium]|nr:nucleotidyltransferase family protein [Dehalococcoidia bacterium]
MITGIILAAGESKRMGKPKQLLSFGSSTILEHVVENLLRSRIGELILVLGHQSGPIEARLEGVPVKKTINPDYREGMSTSIRAGIEAASTESRAFLIALGDQPLVRSEVVDQLVAAYEESGKGIVLPSFGGLSGHPVIFDLKYRDALLSLSGDKGGKSIVAAYPEDVLEVKVETASVVYDIDKWEDYQEQLEQYLSSREQTCG